jgi:hypothetical protein
LCIHRAAARTPPSVERIGKLEVRYFSGKGE